MTVQVDPQAATEGFVIVYQLDDDNSSPLPLSSSPTTPDQAHIDASDDGETPHPDGRRHKLHKYACFRDASELFYSHFGNGQDRQSSIVLMRGFMSATWINNIGGRFVVDPEFFCRHLDTRRSDENFYNFSTPALPSTSWHLIELPVISLGTWLGQRGPIQQDKIEALRKYGKVSLADHHHKLSTSCMALGDSIVRDYQVFDEAHWAIEQRISICMQAQERGKTFDCKSVHTTLSLG